ncbi:testin-like [Corticium candelabrum]|uniref:testin-like n=1 Tax=Corticium candelabrum TaxID=121492 RepID=UPI002E261A7E|nr:testin-like [Corticium candelabrum]
MSVPERRKLKSVREVAAQKGLLVHDVDFGAACLICGDDCPGFELHYWRQICKNCKCFREDHDIHNTEDTKVTKVIGRLFRSRPEPKPVEKKKDIALSAKYSWTPDVDKILAEKYMKELPATKTPLKGTDGHMYRSKQLIHQLPAHDTDSSLCDNLTEYEKQEMSEFLQQQQEVAVGRAAVKDCSVESDASQWCCAKCSEVLAVGSCAVFAEKAGEEACWHPKCFVCNQCEELLVDLIYFWKDDKLYCGRHYAEAVKPRCAACDELIFSREYTRAEDKNWHLKHFCCWECDAQLGGQRYITHESHPYCLTCFDLRFSKLCHSCGLAIPADAPHLSHGNLSWHGSDKCFHCSFCQVSLIGKKFLPREDTVFCSRDCARNAKEQKA